MGKTIRPCLWFNGNGEEAANYYTSVFRDAEILGVQHYGEGAPMPAGSPLLISFRLGDQEFIALNGGPAFTFSEAISFSIDCTDQAEVDYYWEKLTDGGEPGPCGWLKDRFGVSWQVVPRALGEMMQSGDAAQTARLSAAIMTMSKLDVAMLRAAFDGEAVPA